MTHESMHMGGEFGLAMTHESMHAREVRIPPNHDPGERAGTWEGESPILLDDYPCPQLPMSSPHAKPHVNKRKILAQQPCSTNDMNHH